MLGLYEEPRQCEVAGYCDFVDIGEDKKQKVEECTYCHRKAWYNKDQNGRIDNIKYLKDHLRLFCQPYGPTKRIFEEIYGFDYKERDKKIIQERQKVSKEYIFQKYEQDFQLLKKLDSRAIDRIAKQQSKLN